MKNCVFDGFVVFDDFVWYHAARDGFVHVFGIRKNLSFVRDDANAEGMGSAFDAEDVHRWLRTHVGYFNGVGLFNGLPEGFFAVAGLVKRVIEFVR